MSRVKFINQLSQTGCGVACLTMLLNYYGNKVQIFEVSKKCSTSRNGTSLRELIDACESYNLNSRAVKIEDLDTLNDRKGVFPCIAVLNSHHYVVLTRIKKNKVYYIDPQYGYIISTISEFNKNFSGNLLLAEPNDKFCKMKKKVRYISVLSLGEIRFPLFMSVLIATLIIQILSLFSPWLTRYMVDSVIPNHNLNNIANLILASVVVVTVYGMVNFIRQFLVILIEKNYIVSLKKTIVEKLIRLPLRFFDTRSSGEIATRVNNIDVLKRSISQIVSSMTVDLLSIIIFGIVMIINSILLSLIVFSFAIILGIILIVSLKAIKRRNLDALLSQETTQSYLIEALSNTIIIKSSNYGQSVINKWNELHEDQMDKAVSREKVINIHGSLLLSFRMLPPLIVLAIGSTLIGNDNFTLGSLMSFVTIVNLFLSPISLFIQSLFELQYAASILDRIMEIVFTEEEKQNSGNKVSKIKQIEFNNVSFSYSYGKGNLVLNDISFEISEGEKIAFVGKTGCGKTTLIKLILGLYQTGNEEIYVNGRPIQEYDINSYRENFGIVLQDAMFFNDTIRNNIDITRSHSLEEIENAVILACLDDEISRMPLGYDTVIGENGRNISGGQRQRLAIARAFINSPKVVVFDEATNQLDAMTESKIYENMRSKNITQIIITHRLSAIENSDMIFLMEDGKIIQSGKHMQLMNSDLYYSSLFKRQ